MRIRGKIKDLYRFLDYSNLTTEIRTNGEELLIIPVGQDVNKMLGLENIYNLTVLIVKGKEGNLRFSTIISFLPESGNIAHKPIRGTFSNIINNGEVRENGTYDFYNIKGRLLYRLKYKNNKLLAYGRVQQKDESKGSTASRTIKKCTDWWLVTTYYYSDGSTEQTSEYVFTSCDDQDTTPDEGGIDGEDDVPAEEPNDIEIATNISLRNFETNHNALDLAISGDSEPEYDADGGLVIREPFYTPIQYEYRATIYRSTLTGLIKSAIAYPMIAFPINESHEHPAWGWVTRSVSLSNFQQEAVPTAGGIAVFMWWNADVLRRWTYSSYFGIAVEEHDERAYSETRSMFNL